MENNYILKGEYYTCLFATFFYLQTKKSKFNHKKFDLSPYDFIIAQEPCDATEHIVRACIAQNKPFINSLCGVTHKAISGKMPKNTNEWYTDLQNISPNQIKLFYISLDPISTTAILKNKI